MHTDRLKLLKMHCFEKKGHLQVAVLMCLGYSGSSILNMDLRHVVWVETLTITHSSPRLNLLVRHKFSVRLCGSGWQQGQVHWSDSTLLW